MAAKRQRRVPAPSVLQRYETALEAIYLQFGVLAEGQEALRQEIKRDLAAMERRLSHRIDRLTSEVRQNSFEIRQLLSS